MLKETISYSYFPLKQIETLRINLENKLVVVSDNVFRFSVFYFSVLL